MNGTTTLVICLGVGFVRFLLCVAVRYSQHYSDSSPDVLVWDSLATVALYLVALLIMHNIEWLCDRHNGSVRSGHNGSVRIAHNGSVRIAHSVPNTDHAFGRAVFSMYISLCVGCEFTAQAIPIVCMAVGLNSAIGIMLLSPGLIADAVFITFVASVIQEDVSDMSNALCISDLSALPACNAQCAAHHASHHAAQHNSGTAPLIEVVAGK